MSLAPVDIRKRVEESLAGVLGGLSPKGRVSTVPLDRFPGGDLADRESHSFAVGLGSSSALPGRQNQAAALVPAETAVIVRWTWLLSQDNAVDAYDEALKREVLVVGAVIDADGDDGPAPRFVSATRRVEAGGTLFVGEITFAVFHGYPLV